MIKYVPQYINSRGGIENLTPQEHPLLQTMVLLLDDLLWSHGSVYEVVPFSLIGVRYRHPPGHQACRCLGPREEMVRLFAATHAYQFLSGVNDGCVMHPLLSEVGESFFQALDEFPVEKLEGDHRKMMNVAMALAMGIRNKEDLEACINLPKDRPWDKPAILPLLELMLENPGVSFREILQLA